MSDAVHLLDELATGLRFKAYCNDLVFAAWNVATAENRVYTMTGGNRLALDPTSATCPTCIEAYETRPQPVTTEDLLEVLKIARWLAHSGPPRAGGKNPSGAAAHKLEQRLKRPRRAKPVEEPLK